MKTFSLLRLLFIVCLLLGIGVSYMASAPASVSGTYFYGAWYPMYGMHCCDDIKEDDVCPNGYDWGDNWLGCTGYGLKTCILAANPPTPEQCSADGPVRCGHVWPGSVCHDMHDAKCTIPE